MHVVVCINILLILYNPEKQVKLFAWRLWRCDHYVGIDQRLAHFMYVFGCVRKHRFEWNCNVTKNMCAKCGKNIALYIYEYENIRTELVRSKAPHEFM